MIDLVYRFVLPAAYAVLPKPMASSQASALLLAIGMQESRFEYRQQIHGPACSFWQFELTGVQGVLEHHHAGPIARGALALLRYDSTKGASYIHAAMQHNDILAAVIARCLLWTDSRPLPYVTERDLGWQIYTETWRPGKPRRETWTDCYARAWARVEPPAIAGVPV